MSYLGRFKAPSTDKPASKNLLIAKNAVVGILILVQKLLELVAFGGHLCKMTSRKNFERTRKTGT